MREIGRCMGYDEGILSLDGLDSKARNLRFRFLKFDLDKFFKNISYSDGGVIMVTPKQVIGAENFVSTPYDNRRNHDCTFDYINDVIYSVEKNLSAIETSNVRICHDGNIGMYLLDNFGKILCLIYVPNNITREQYDFMHIFNERIKDLYLSDKEYYNIHKMIFGVSEFKNGRFSEVASEENGLDKIMDKLRDFVGNREVLDNEKIIGYEIGMFNLSDELDINVKKLSKN